MSAPYLLTISLIWFNFPLSHLSLNFLSIFMEICRYFPLFFHLSSLETFSRKDLGWKKKYDGRFQGDGESFDGIPEENSFLKWISSTGDTSYDWKIPFWTYPEFQQFFTCTLWIFFWCPQGGVYGFFFSGTVFLIEYLGKFYRQNVWKCEKKNGEK